LKSHLQTTLVTLLRAGASQREIERVTGISRHTIRAWQRRLAAEQANCLGVATVPADQTAPPWPPAARLTAQSTCEPHRPFIEQQLRLGCNAMAIYLDLVDRFGSLNNGSMTARRREVFGKRAALSLLSPVDERRRPAGRCAPSPWGC